jgi:hypothetical protein
VRPAPFVIGASAVLLSFAGCGNTRVVRERPGVLVITLDVEPTAYASLPMHLFVRNRHGRVVVEDSLHSAPLVYLVKPGSYQVTAAPGCSGAVRVPPGGAPGGEVAAVARVLLWKRFCDVRQIE